MNGRKAKAIRRAAREQGAVNHTGYNVREYQASELSPKSIRKNTWILGPVGQRVPTFVNPRTYHLPIGCFKQACKEYKREAVPAREALAKVKPK